MGALYSGTSVSGYNANPPPDDGTQVATNQLSWSGIKSKLGDPLNTFAGAASTALQASFTKTISGGSVVKTAVNYAATAADQGRNIVATASGITVTTPDATSVLSPFVWCINNQSTGNISIAGFGGTQNIDGATSAKLGAGRGIILWTDSVNWFSSGIVMGNLPLSNPPFGFDSPINLQLNATTASSALTIAVKANDGTDPSSTNPVLIPFHNPSGATGNTSPGPSGPLWLAVTAALSVVVPSGQTMGTANNVPFRFWVVAVENNAGAVELALINCVVGAASPTQIVPLAEHNLINTAAIGSAASAGVFYSTIARNNLAFRIIGYVEFAAGMATAGTYTGSPTNVQLFGPGVKKPGDRVQIVYGTSTSATTINATNVQTSLSAAITPTSTANLILVNASFSSTMTSQPGATSYRMSRGTGPTYFGSQILSSLNATGTSIAFPGSLLGIDAPAAVASTTYYVYGSTGSGSSTFNSGAGQVAVMTAEEIMG